MTSARSAGADTGGERATDPREGNPQAEERGVREPAVERLPAAIGTDRPHDRRARPHDEEHERGDQGDRRCAEPRQRDDAEREGDDEPGEENDGRAADREHAVEARPVSRERRSEEHGSHEGRGDDERRAVSSPPPRRTRALAGGPLGRRLHSAAQASSDFGAKPPKEGGYWPTSSNRSFTLHTPLDHLWSGDSAQPDSKGSRSR